MCRNKQKNTLYKEVCDSVYSVIHPKVGNIISLYVLLKDLCNKWNMSLHLDKGSQLLHCRKDGDDGYERIVYLVDILQHSITLKTIRTESLPKAEFQDINDNANIGNGDGILSEETTQFLTTNQNIVYSYEFLVGLKNYMLSPVLAEASKQTEYAYNVFICTIITTIITAIVNMPSLLKALCILISKLCEYE